MDLTTAPSDGVYTAAVGATATPLRDEEAAVAAAPRLIIKMETIESIYSSNTVWRVPRTYAPLTPAERAEYYKAYDPMTGLKIAATLSGLLTMAVLYVFYKAKCRRLKYFRRRSSDAAANANNAAQQSSSSGKQQQQPPPPLPPPPPPPPLSCIINNESASANSGAVSPKSLAAMQQLGDEPHHLARPQRSRINSESGRDTPGAGSVSTHASNTAKTHYYIDDRDMPPWKIYAKELFLYGGPGLWRSASLKGSDPLLLMAQCSFDETYSPGRTQLRTNSLSGSMTGGLYSRKTSVMGSSNVCNSHLQVPGYRHRLRMNGRQFTEDEEKRTGELLTMTANIAKKIPARSVSFRENETTKERKRLARSRPGSLRAQSDYCRSERPSFRWPRRHLSVRDGKPPAQASQASQPSPPPPPPPAHARDDPVQTSAKITAIKLPAFSRKISRSKSLHVRSSSLSNESGRSIRSRLSKIIRAKSSAGDHETCDVEGGHVAEPGAESRPDVSYGGVIDICVIQATPAASPCASIKSTFSGDSIELGLKSPPSPGPKPKRNAMSLRDRRRCFANTKGQTIDHDHQRETGIDPAYLAPPSTNEFHPTVTPTRQQHHQQRHHLTASSLLEVFRHDNHRHQQHANNKGKCSMMTNKSAGSSKSLSVDLFNSSAVNNSSSSF